MSWVRARFRWFFLGAILGSIAAQSLAIEATSQPFPFAIVMRNAEFLHGEPLRFLAIYQAKGGKLIQMRHQIDERNRNNDYVLSEGLPFTADTDDGYFDGNDELVIWGPDLSGEKLPGKIPAAYKKMFSLMWKVKIQSLSGQHGEVLVVSHLSPVKGLVREPLVQFNSTTNVVRTAEYQYGFLDEKAALLGNLQLKMGDEFRSLIRASRFLLNLNLPWYLPNFTMSDESIISTVESWQTGMLRSIVAVGVKFRGVLSILKLHLFSELVFYENAINIPTVIEFAFEPEDYFKPGTGIAYALEFDKDMDFKFESNLTPLPSMNIEQLYAQKARASDVQYFYVGGKVGDRAAVIRVRVDREAASRSIPPMVFEGEMFRDEELHKHWNWLGKTAGDLGVFLDISGVHKGSYDFGLDLFLTSEANERIVSEVESLKLDWSAIPVR